MNQVNTNTDRRGIILTDNVNMEYLKEITPRYSEDFCKFVVNTELNQVCVGMDIHAQCDIVQGDGSAVYGGNIFFEDGHIIYESTLNIRHNLKSSYFKRNRKENNNPRIIQDPDIIQIINAVLFAWIEL